MSLREISGARQLDGELPRRWFTSRYFDVFIHYDKEQTITGFELCYDKGRRERVLTWKADGTVNHHRVDDGETEPMKAKMTPVYLPDGEFDMAAVKARFQQEASDMDPQVRDYILLKLTELETLD